MASALETYAKEFSGPEFVIPAETLEMLERRGFKDQSWHNDACPSFHNETLRLTVYIDCADEAKREFVDAPRCLITNTDQDGVVLDDGRDVTCEDITQLERYMICPISEAELRILTEEYAAWNKAQGLNLGSADEHMWDESLSDAQRAWIKDFVSRWENSCTLHGPNGPELRREM